MKTARHDDPRRSRRVRKYTSEKAKLQRELGFVCNCGARLANRQSFQRHLATAKVHQKRGCIVRSTAALTARKKRPSTASAAAQAGVPACPRRASAARAPV